MVLFYTCHNNYPIHLSDSRMLRIGIRSGLHRLIVNRVD